MSPDLAKILEERGIGLGYSWDGVEKRPLWVCEKCWHAHPEKWNRIEHAKDCPNVTLVAERYAEVESRPKTPCKTCDLIGEF